MFMFDRIHKTACEYSALYIQKCDECNAWEEYDVWYNAYSVWNEENVMFAKHGMYVMYACTHNHNLIF